MKPPVQRMLRWFEKDPGDALIGETELRGVELEELQRVFGVEQSNPMYDSWEVDERQRPFLERHTGVRIDLSKFDYYVDADAK